MLSRLYLQVAGRPGRATPFRQLDQRAECVQGAGQALLADAQRFRGHRPGTGKLAGDEQRALAMRAAGGVVVFRCRSG